MDNSLTVGNALISLFCLGAAMYIYFKTKENAALLHLSEWVKEHDDVTEHQEAQFTLLRDNITRLTALQETVNIRITGVDREIENLRRFKHDTNNVLMKHEATMELLKKDE